MTERSYFDCLTIISQKKMTFSKITRLATGIVFLVLLSHPFSFVYATEFFAFRLTGSDCTLCHTDPKTGSLNQAGTLFQEKGYRSPLTWKGLFFSILLGLILCLVSLDSAVKVLNLDDKIRVKDILELVRERMEP